MGELRDLPEATFPTAREARAIVGLKGFWFTEPARVDEIRLHPTTVMQIAEGVHLLGLLDRSFNEVAGDLIEYADTHCPDSSPAVVETLAEFFRGRVSEPIQTHITT
jgi:hypothetical protein